jgi:hypothetical protein
MSESVDWRQAFTAFGTLLGEPADAVGGALGEPVPGADIAQPHDASASRATRARAVAAVVTKVLADLERARLR